MLKNPAVKRLLRQYSKHASKYDDMTPLDETLFLAVVTLVSAIRSINKTQDRPLPRRVAKRKGPNIFKKKRPCQVNHFRSNDRVLAHRRTPMRSIPHRAIFLGPGRAAAAAGIADKAEMANRVRAAAYAGANIGEQLSLFLDGDPAPAVDRPYKEGQACAMENKAAVPKFDPNTEQYRAFMEGYLDEQTRSKRSQRWSEAPSRKVLPRSTLWGPPTHPNRWHRRS
jgi:hypothetical protein